MPTIIQTFQGKVTGLWGQASIRGADGKMHPLKLGDFVHQGDVILTTQDGIVRLSPEGSDIELAGSPGGSARKPAIDEIDRVINALNDADPQAATAAGLAGGDGAGDLTPGLRVDRITEGLTPFALLQGGGDESLRSAREVPAASDAVTTAAPVPAEPLANNAPVAVGDTAATAINTPVIVAVLANDTDRDGNTLTLTDATLANPAQGSVVVNADGTLTFTPASNASGPVAITYTVSDGQGGSASASVTVTVGANTAPSGADAARALPEDGSYVVATADFGFTDPDAGQTLAAIRIDSIPAAGSLLLDGATVTAGTLVSAADIAAGHLTFVPAANANGAPYASFGFSVQDSAGAFDPAPNTINFSVTPVNDAPFARNDLASTPINAALASIDVLGNDSDVDGDTLSVTGAALANPALGSVSINPDGTLNFTPANNVSGPVAINYTISDGHGGTSSAVLTVNVGANTPPAGADATITIDEDTSKSFSVADFGYTDADTGQALANVRIDALPAAGTLMFNGVPVAAGQVLAASDLAQLEFTPAANASGNAYASFTFSVQDSAGAFDPAPNTITFNVSPVADGFADGSEVISVNEDTTSTGSVLTGTTSVDGPVSVTQFVVGTTTYAAGDTASIAGVGSLTIAANGAYTFTPAANYTGPVPVATYTLSDGTSTDSSTLTMVVNPVADPAVISGAANGATVEDTTLVASGQLDVVDPDAGEASFQPQTNFAGAHGTFSIDSSGNWTYALNSADPAVQALGQGQALPNEVFTVRSVDGTTANVTVTITGTDDAPNISTGTGAVTENTAPTATGTLTATDVDNPTLAFVPATISGSYGSLTLLANGQWTYTLDARAEPLAQNQVIDEPIAVQLTDGSTTTVTITVTGTNDPAVITGTASGAVTEDAGLVAVGTLMATDVDSPAAFTPRSVSLTYGDFVIDAAGNWTYTLRNGDANVQALASSQHPTETVTVATADGTTQQITITVNGANEGPTAIVTPAGGAEDAAGVPITLAGGDVDGTLASFTVSGLPLNGTLLYAGNPVTVGMVIPASANSASLSFVPDANWNGSTSLTFSATDNEGANSAPVTQSITVAAVNDAPIATADAGALNEGATLSVAAASGVLANDSDVDAGDTKAVSAVAFGAAAGTVGSVLTGTYGTLTLNADGSYSYQATQPAATALTQGQVATESFNYTMVDATGVASTSTLTFTVTGVNNAPIATPDTSTVSEDVPLVVVASPTTGLLVNDSDPDAGTSLSITQFGIAGDPTNYAAGSAAVIAGVGTLTIDANGSYSFTPAPNYNGPVPVATYTVSDGITTAQSTLTLSVAPVNDAPVLSLDSDHSHNTVAVQAIGGLFNTGQSDTGTALATGSPDPHYSVVSAAAGSTLTATAAGLAAGWVANDADSTWIGSSSGQPTGVYQYQTSFTLQAGADPRSVHIAFDLSSDNNLRDILVNGVSTGFTSDLQFTQFTHVELDGGTAAFGNGVNTITFVVDNRDPGSPADSGPTGLRIDNIGGNVAVVTPDAVAHQGDYAAIYVEGTPVSIGDNDVRIQDIDSPTLQSATITLTNPQIGDVLQLGTLPAGVTASVNAAGTLVTLSGSATLAVYEAAIRAVQFDSTSDSPSGAVDRLVTVVVNDGFANSNTATTTIHVVPVNDAPTLDLDGNNSTAPGTGYSGTFVEGGSGVPIIDADSVILDTDSATLHSATIHITNAQAGDAFSIGAMPAGILAAVYDPVAGVLTLSGNATIGDYRTALGNIGFVNTSDTPSAVARTIEITVNDGSANSNVAVSTISVVPENNAPVANADTGSGVEDSAQTGNVLTNDTDVDSASLSVTQFSIGANTYAAGTTAAIAGVGTLVIAPNGAYTFTPSADWNGSVPTVNYTASDGALTSSSTLTLGVSAVNDAPVAAADTATATEAGGVANGTAGVNPTGNVLTNDTDVDTGDTKAVSAVSGVAAGTVGGSTAGTYGSLVLNANGSYTYSVDNSSTAVQALRVAGDTLTDTFTYTMRDTAGATSSTTISFTITGTNDAPVAVADTGNATEDVTLSTSALTGVLANDSDVDSGDTKTVSGVAFGASAGTVGSGLAGTYGTLTLNADGSYSYLANKPAAEALGTGQTATEVFTYTVRDTAGAISSASLSFTITGTDDAPVVGTSSVRVSEEGLSGANADSTGATDTTDLATASGSIALSDVDNAALTVTLGAPATALTSAGTAITWQSSNGGHTLIGKAGTTTIITASIDDSGNYTVTLSGPVDHADTSAEDVKSFGITVNVSDGSATSTSTLTVGIEDDSPVIGTPANTILYNGAGAFAEGDLHLKIGADAGSGAKVVFAGTSVDANGFITGNRVDQAGTVVGSGLLTYNGSKLHFISGSDGSLSAVDASNTAVYTVSGDVASGHYNVTMLHALDPVQVTTAVFGSVTAGNNSTYAFSDGTNTFDLTATGYASNGILSTVNTNSSSFGVANQSIDAGEKLVFDIRAHGSGNPSQVTGVGVTAHGLGDGESLTWSAYDASHNLVGQGVVNGSGSGSTNDVAVNLTSANFSGGAFSSIEFGGGAGTSYKLQLDSLVGNSEFLHQTTSIAVHGTDSDGDPSATQAVALTFNANTTLTGTSSEDALAGGSFNDALSGGAGNDLLIGGKGSDTLTGGTGADVFKWALADHGTNAAKAADTVTDFDNGPAGDKLDLRDLLVGEHADQGNLANFLHFSVTGGSTKIEISSSGGFTGGTYSAAAVDQTITLSGVDLKGSFTNDNQIINDLITRNKLVVDH